MCLKQEEPSIGSPVSGGSTISQIIIFLYHPRLKVHLFPGQLISVIPHGSVCSHIRAWTFWCLCYWTLTQRYLPGFRWIGLVISKQLNFPVDTNPLPHSIMNEYQLLIERYTWVDANIELICTAVMVIVTRRMRWELSLDIRLVWVPRYYEHHNCSIHVVYIKYPSY